MSNLKAHELDYGERIGSGGSDSILSSYFRDILMKLHIDSHRFQGLIDRYIINNGLASNSAEISTSRSSIRREFMSSTMTWRVFVKALMFLRVEKIKITLMLYRDDSKLSVHEYYALINKEANATEEESNTLAKFYREILEDLDITDDNFQEYLDLYVKYSKPGAEPSVQYTTKCSFRREVLKDHISWKMFVKGLIFLRVYKMIFQLDLFHQNSLITSHEKILSFR